jgi:hypothetical protein
VGAVQARRDALHDVLDVGVVAARRAVAERGWQSMASGSGIDLQQLYIYIESNA